VLHFARTTTSAFLSIFIAITFTRSAVNHRLGDQTLPAQCAEVDEAWKHQFATLTSYHDQTSERGTPAMQLSEVLWFTASTTDPRSIHPPDIMPESRPEGWWSDYDDFDWQYDPEEIQELEEIL
jgi:hypothetical protein